MKKNATPVKATKAAAKTTATVKPAKATAFKCACPYCDDEVTENKTPLFCTPCAPVATIPVMKQTTRKAKSGTKTK